MSIARWKMNNDELTANLLAEHYQKGFMECKNMCIKIVKESSVNGKLDVEDSANYLIEKIGELS